MTLQKWLGGETPLLNGLLTVAGDQMLTMKLAVIQPLFKVARDAVTNKKANGDDASAAGSEQEPEKVAEPEEAKAS